MVGLIREVFGSKAVIWVEGVGEDALLKVVGRMSTVKGWGGGLQ